MIYHGSLEEIEMRIKDFFQENPILTEPLIQKIDYEALLHSEGHEPYCYLYGCHFSVHPIYVYGVVNVRINEGTLFIQEKECDYLADIAGQVMKLFPESTYRHKRKMIYTFGARFAKLAAEFHDQEKTEDPELLPTLYLNDLEVIEDQMEANGVSIVQPAVPDHIALVADLMFAYLGKDPEQPHPFELEAIRQGIDLLEKHEAVTPQLLERYKRLLL